ncbi:MAG TPA: cation-transporting P-type ATPase [Steroidobacteraceae bacterium]|nr:cation-transporting P-type ATPase [Steroidobacteraceae bacterium]
MLHPVPADRIADIAAGLADGERGLAADQVAERRARFGANAIVEEARGPWRELARETARDPMIWFLIGIGILYALIGEPDQALVLIGAIVPLIGMDAWLHRRTRVSTRALGGKLASHAEVIRDGVATVVPAMDLVPGDRVRLPAGESIPADGLIVRGEALQADESALTGESAPARKAPLAAALEAAVDSVHWGFAGTRLLTGDALMCVVATGADTLYGEIVRSARAGERGRTPLQQAIGRLVLILVTAAAGLCIVLGAVRLWQGYGLADALLSAATLAVAAIPEEFPVVFTFFLGFGVYRLAQRQALVRRAVAVENIGRVSCLCMDKTGTLTEGRLQFAHAVPADGVGEPALLQLAALASRREGHDPLDAAILRAVHGPAAAAGARVALFPFTEDRRRETTIWRGPAGDGRLLAVCKGAPETVLARCGLDAAQAAHWRGRADELAATQRVIACASRHLEAGEFTGGEPDRDFTFAGLLAFEDPLRKGAAEAVRRAHQAGVRLVLVTGDHPAYALAIAREAGIGDPQSGVVLGESLEPSIAQQGAAFLSGLRIVARALPAHKLLLVRALQRVGEVVAVTGDGVNDVPALKAADVGIAMGESATQSAREAGAIVLLDDDLRTIVNAVAEGRQLFRNLRLSFAYLLIVHLPLVSTAALIPLLGYPLLYLPIHIVWLELIIHPTAMLAFQAPAGMRRHSDVPRRRARFFSRRDWTAIAVAGVLMAAALVAGYRYALASGGIEHARAMALVALIVAWVMTTALLTGLATRAARAITALTLLSAFAFTQWPPAAALLGLQPLHADDWLYAVVAGLLTATPALALRMRRR